jgi:uncharacterized membrane protein YedE/YeeE
MENFTPVSGLIGGIILGLAAIVLLLFNGKVAGVSGIAGGLLNGRPGDRDWRAMFLAGLLLGAALAWRFLPSHAHVHIEASLPVLIVAGLLVGYGTRLGNGCTSGHGVCGLARLSLRSLVATGVFMATAFVTVYLMRHVF